jgi:hypothetical protein
VVAGLNEGFADLVAFGVTGGTDVFADLPELAQRRSLRDDGLHYDRLGECPGGFYCVGTLFARALYGAFLDGGGDPASLESRAAFVREATAALAAAPAILAARGSLPPPAPGLCGREEIEPGPDGLVLGPILDAVAAGLPAAACDELIERFGATGFPEVARITCAR